MTWRVASYVVWAALALAGLGLEVLGLVRGRADTVGRSLQRLCARPAARALLVLGWMWSGWHFFAR